MGLISPISPLELIQKGTIDMQQNVNVVLIGLSAYGTFYAKALVEQGNEKSAKLVAVIDPFADKNPYFETIKSLDIPRYNTVGDYAKAACRQKASLALIASPIHLHAPQTCEALKSGMNVLCEKPITGAVQHAFKMMSIRDKTEKFVAIGYNWSFFKEILKIKQDFLEGKFGKALQMKTLLLNPRSPAYYNRNNWAGKIASANGEWILDSPVNNAHSHYLHNMFFITGDSWYSSAVPQLVKAELYRANDIENYDTACMECQLTNGAKLLFVTSHATQNSHKIMIQFDFEKGRLTCDGLEFKMHWNDGTIFSYGMMDENQYLNKLWQCVDATKGTASPPYCGIEAGISQTISMNAAQESPAKIINFPKPYVKIREETAPDQSPVKFVYVEGLDEVLLKSYEEWKMPSELGCEWAIPSSSIDCTNYKKFPSAKRFAS
jgi:predicted dehydrogenase